MDALKKVFADKKREDAPALVTFVTAGYPTANDTVPVMLAMQKGGADIIELGVPFTDPTADGPAIQETYQIALQNKTDYSQVLCHLREARSRGLTIPVVIMGYHRPFVAYGEDKAINDAAEAGANGFIVVDLTLEETFVFRGKCARANLSYIPLIAPSTSVLLMKLMASLADTFIYVISRPGKTGSSITGTVNPGLPDIISRVRQHATVPLAVGFGIATREHVDTVAAAGADGAVIGSRLVGVMKSAPLGQLSPNVEAYCREMSVRDEKVKAVVSSNGTADVKKDSPLSQLVPHVEAYCREMNARDEKGKAVALPNGKVDVRTAVLRVDQEGLRTDFVVATNMSEVLRGFRMINRVERITPTLSRMRANRVGGCAFG